MKSLYVEGNGWLHRLSARKKLIGLAVFSLILFASRDIVLLSILTTLAAITYFTISPRDWREMARRLRPVFLLIIAVALFNLLIATKHDAAVTLFRLSGLMFAAASVTSTTTISAFMDEVTALAMPLERIGLLKAADIGLAVGLVMRFVPDITNRYQTIRDAHQARGLKVKWRTSIVPLIILTLKDADSIADAIDARGFRGQTSAPEISRGPDNHDHP